MALPLLYVIIAGSLYATMGLGYKVAERRGARSLPFTAAFCLVATLFALGKSASEETAWHDPRLWALGVGMGFLLIGAIVTLCQANRLGPPSLVWTIGNASVLLPVFVSPLLFNEAFLWVDPMTLLLFVGALLCFARGMKREAGTSGGRGFHGGWRLTLALALQFLMNGGFVLCNKVKEHLYGGENSAGLAMIFYGTGALLPLFILARRRVQPLISRNELKAALLTGGCSCVGTLFFLAGMSLPSAVAFPLSGGIAHLGGIALTTWVYGEVINRWKALGVTVSVLSIGCAVFRQPLAELLSSKW
ncbi:MAG: hypothetical protein ACYTGH_03385 [Planctomycetota bacterium]|jgi:drug/metabolite transporter (DMT)-like permease